MPRLRGHVVSNDDIFTSQISGLLRSGGVWVTVAGRGGDNGPASDVAIVDGRTDAATAIAKVEDLRAGSPAISIFVVAMEASQDLILRSMRAGANEFLTWPIEAHSLEEAIRRAATHRASQPGGKPQAATHVFIGAKGGAGTTTVAVNCAVDVSRLSKRPTVMVDLKAGLGEVALFTGVRNRYSILDAIDNLHRLDIEFLCELLARHKSGLEILAGSEQFERPGPADSPAVEEIFQLLGQQYDHILVDAGCQLNACVVPVLYGATAIFVVANPDVPSVRNAQRMLERIGQLGPCGERVRVVLNRASASSPISPAQIEKALGYPIYQTFPSDYKTVSGALNAGTPLALSSGTDLAKKFDRFTKRILDPSIDAPSSKGGRTAPRFARLAAFW